MCCDSRLLWAIKWTTENRLMVARNRCPSNLESEVVVGRHSRGGVMSPLKVCDECFALGPKEILT